MNTFGTRGPAQATYDALGRRLQAAFPGHSITWAYSSRIVRHLEERGGKPRLPGPTEALSELAAQGHRWAVIQSTHMLCGHEFHRMLIEARQAPLRTSIGLPLLTDPRDFDCMAQVLGDMAAQAESEATVFVGHGTDHPTWIAYPLLQFLLNRIGAKRTYVGVLEGRPGVDEVLEAIVRSGVGKVRILPLLLVAGNHFHKDLTAKGPQSWQSRFEAAGLVVDVVGQGIGLLPQVADLFCQHIREALDVIPSSQEP